MNTLTFDDVPSLSFTPVAGMPHWTQAMQRATQAERTGQMAQALTHYQLALGHAQHWLLGAGSPSADECLSALVSSHLCIAGLLEAQGSTDEAAKGLAKVHQALLRIIYQQTRASAWHRAAIWHSRDTHAALLAFVQTHGRHPVIDDAFRAGCLSLCVPSAQLH